MRKFEYIFIFIFIGVTIVLLLMPRKGLFKRVEKGAGLPGGRLQPRLSYFKLILLISGIISLAVLLVIKYLLEV